MKIQINMRRLNNPKTSHQLKFKRKILVINRLKLIIMAIKNNKTNKRRCKTRFKTIIINLNQQTTLSKKKKQKLTSMIKMKSKSPYLNKCIPRKSSISRKKDNKISTVIQAVVVMNNGHLITIILLFSVTKS